MKKSILLGTLLLLLAACAPAPATETLTVYFLDENMFAVGSEPYEKAVSRQVTAEGDRWEATLDLMFLGPTEEEQAQGLALVTSGATGYSEFRVEDGVAHITLVGDCSSGGSTYTIANLLAANLKQYPAIKYVKVYDQAGDTENPTGKKDSIPTCLEP